MKVCFFLIIIIVLSLVSSNALGTEYNISQENILTTLTPSTFSTLTPSEIDSGSGYTNQKTTTVPSTPDSNTPVIRYTNENLPETINNLIEHIDFQTTKDIKTGQVFIYFILPSPNASVNQSKAVGDFICSRKEWIGDRSPESVTAEIYIHWIADNALPLFTTNPINEALYEEYIIGSNDKRPSPIYPTHLGYNYVGLDKTNIMDQFLLTL